MQKKFQEFENQKYMSFYNTINKSCTDFSLEKESVIETYIFEDLNIDIRCYLSEENLTLFLERGLITEDIKEKCLELKTIFYSLEVKYPELWNIDSVKNSVHWRKFFNKAKEIKSMLYW